MADAFRDLHMTLEEFVGESVDRSVKRGFHPVAFMRIRAERGTVPAIRRLIEGGASRSGFDRFEALGMTEWSLEAAVLKFPDRFNASTLENARARLRGTKD